MVLTKTQVDQLGDRLRKASITEPDLKLLDAYRRSFRDAYQRVIESIRERLGLEATGRPAKSTTSIVEKLIRETLRLSQMQDIAGCRIIVPDSTAQERDVAILQATFNGVTVVDRRESPSYGYRAVHIIAREFGNPIEIQVRTVLQHLWAELSEKWSDVIDPAIKYGGGPDEFKKLLMRCSDVVMRVERRELSYGASRLASAEEAMGISDLREEIRNLLLDIAKDEI